MGVAQVVQPDAGQAHLGYGLAHYADFYEIKHVLLMGRCTSGRGGELILRGARQVLRAEFPNPRRELLPGTFVRVRFPQAELDNAIRVPQRAVQGGPTGQLVMTVDAEGKVVPRPITTSAMTGSDFIVTDGLKAGDQVIVNGLQKARPGTPVKAVPWNPQPAPAPAPAANQQKKG